MEHIIHVERGQHLVDNGLHLIIQRLYQGFRLELVELGQQLIEQIFQGLEQLSGVGLLAHLVFDPIECMLHRSQQRTGLELLQIANHILKWF